MSQYFNSLEVGSSFDEKESEEREIILSEIVNLILSDVQEMAEIRPICREFTKGHETEIFCKMSAITVLNFGAEIPLASLDFITNMRITDPEAVMLSSFLIKEDHCVYKNDGQTIFEDKDHCKQAIDIISGEIGSENNFD